MQHEMNSYSIIDGTQATIQPAYCREVCAEALLANCGLPNKASICFFFADRSSHIRRAAPILDTQQPSRSHF
jgi:hypothetical protein